MKGPVRSSASAFATTALVAGALCGCGSAHNAAGSGDGGALGDSGVDGGVVDAPSGDDVVDAPSGADAGDAAAMSDDAALPAVAGVRFAVWATAPFPAVDFCLAPHGTTAFIGPLLHSLATAADGGSDDASVVLGLTYPLVTSYFSVPVGRYDARVVAAGAADCQVGVFPDASDLPALGADGTETIALLDQVDPEAGSRGVQITGFADDAAASIMGSVSDDGASIQGRPLIRFINAAGSEPLADLGFALDSNPLDLRVTFSSVPFGRPSNVSVGNVLPADTDPQGYVSLPALVGSALPAVGTSAPAVAGEVFGARRSGSVGLIATATLVAAPGAVISLVLLQAPTASSDAASSGLDGGAVEQLLVCFDNAPNAGPLSGCYFSPSP